MAPKLIWTPLAEKDLLDIYILIGADNLRAADAVYNRLRDAGIKLRENPRLGVARDEIRPGARMFVQKPYLIIYRLLPDDKAMSVTEIEIIRVVDGRRDLATLF